MSCLHCGDPSVLPGLVCQNPKQCATNAYTNRFRRHAASGVGTSAGGHAPAVAPASSPEAAGFERMGREVTKAASLFGRWLLGENLLEAVDAEHGTNIAPMASMAGARLKEVRDEVERTIQVREANVAAREQATQELKQALNKPEAWSPEPGACLACRGVGAVRVEVGGIRQARLCDTCQGSGKTPPTSDLCEVCDGDGAIIVTVATASTASGTRSKAMPCTACHATGRKQP